MSEAIKTQKGAWASGKNQSEGEFFAMVETGRKGMEQMLTLARKDIMPIAAANVRDDWDPWAQRFMLHVLSRWRRRLKGSR